MDDMALKILGLHRAEFEKAKLFQSYSWMAEFIVAFLALFAIFINRGWIVYLSTIGALIFTFFAWRLSYQSKQLRSNAERARRVLLLMEGLGYEFAKIELIDIISGFSVSEEAGRNWEDPNYYKSDLGLGAGKFCSLLQESAFLSKHLYRISARLTWTFFIIILLLSITTLLVIPVIENPVWAIAIAKIISSILMFLIVVKALEMALEFSNAFGLVDGVDNRIEALKKSAVSEQDLLLIFSDYNAIVEGVPLIPTSIYDKHQARINRLWINRM